MLQSQLLHIFAIVAAALIAYSNSFDVPFVFDDYQNILETPTTKDLSYYAEPSKAEPLLIYERFRSRYVGYLSFTLGQSIHGMEEVGFHVTNLMIHIANGLLIYLLVVLAFKSPLLVDSNSGKYSGHIAIFSALIFVSHPVHTQAVTYIVQRFASLAAMFSLASITAYAGTRILGRRLLYVISLLFMILAMKTKETAFTFPLVIALFEAAFMKGKLGKRVVLIFPFIVAMSIIPISLLDLKGPVGEIVGEATRATRLQTGIPRVGYLLTESRVMFTYLRLLVFPLNQNLDYDYPLYVSPSNPEVLGSVLIIALVLAFAVCFLLRFRSIPLAMVFSFCIFWFFITISVESSLIPIEDVIFEHRAYLPSVGLIVLIVSLVFSSAGMMSHGRVGVIVALTLLVAVFTAANLDRNNIWRTEIGLWEDVVKKSPGKFRPHDELGVAYASAGQMDKATKEFRKAIELDPRSVRTYLNLGNAYYLRGLIDDAIAQYAAVLRVQPNNRQAHHNIGMAYRMKGLDHEAEEHLSKAASMQ